MIVPIVADVAIGRNAADQVELPNLQNDYDLEAAFEEASIGYDLPPQKIPPRKGRIVVPDYLDTGVSDDELS